MDFDAGNSHTTDSYETADLDWISTFKSGYLRFRLLDKSFFYKQLARILHEAWPDTDFMLKSH